MRVSSKFFSSFLRQEEGAGRSGHPTSYSLGCGSGTGLEKQINLKISKQIN